MGLCSSVVEPRGVNQEDRGLNPPAAFSKLRRCCSPHSLCHSEETLKDMSISGKVKDPTQEVNL